MIFRDGETKMIQGMMLRDERATIAIVEDDPSYREALAFQLETAGFRVADYASAHALLESERFTFDCLIADIIMPGIDGLALQERLASEARFLPIIFVTGRGDLTVGVEAMKRGAVDVLEKPVSEQALLAAVRRALEQARSEGAIRLRTAETSLKYRSLPARQREVFTLITAGLLNKQVAAEMKISERTVKVHRERLRRRMGADSLAELSRMAELLGIHSEAGSRA